MSQLPGQIGRADPGLWLYSCSAWVVASLVQVLAHNGTFDRVRCTVNAGVGTLLRFTLLVCAPGLFGEFVLLCVVSIGLHLFRRGVHVMHAGCYPMFDKGNNVMSYAAPVFKPGTLHFTASPVQKSTAIGAVNSLPQLVSMTVSNLVNDSSLVRVGP